MASFVGGEWGNDACPQWIEYLRSSIAVESFMAIHGQGLGLSAGISNATLTNQLTFTALVGYFTAKIVVTRSNSINFALQQINNHGNIQ